MIILKQISGKMFKKKYLITILDDNWNLINDKLKVLCIPKQDELIYLEDKKKYFRIIHVIHQIDVNHRVILVVKEFSQDILGK